MPPYYCPRAGCKKFHTPDDDEYQKHRFLDLDDDGGVDLAGMASKHPSFRVISNAVEEDGRQ